MNTSLPTASAVDAQIDQGKQAIVVFSDDCSLITLRYLKRGFRHCFIVIRDVDAWVVCDPLAHYTAIDIMPPWLGSELVFWYADLGLTAVTTRTQQPQARLAPIRPFTCVEAVKRALGLRAPWIFTPWQLYGLLRSQELRSEHWRKCT